MEYFFKTKEERPSYGITPIEIAADDAWIREIPKSEYDRAMEALARQQETEAETERIAEQTKDARIAELEAENAALLFQLLTGEELDDV